MSQAKTEDTQMRTLRSSLPPHNSSPPQTNLSRLLKSPTENYLQLLPYFLDADVVDGTEFCETSCSIFIYELKFSIVDISVSTCVYSVSPQACESEMDLFT